MRTSNNYVPLDPAVIEQARQMDLLTYLQRYEPSNLKRVAGSVYCTAEHDSLKISNGKWYWWSRGIGGVSALDYLIKVRDFSFVEAVQTILTTVTMPQAKRFANGGGLSLDRLHLPAQSFPLKLLRLPGKPLLGTTV